LIGAMTGGAELSGTINRNLAAAAQWLGVGMMLGSQRIMLDSALGEETASSFTARDVAPDVLLFRNIGLSQRTVAAVDDISNALKRVGADVLAVHANPLQEAVQRNGDSDFAGSIDRLREVAGALEYPVLLKEVGHGIGASAVAELTGPLVAAAVHRRAGNLPARCGGGRYSGPARYRRATDAVSTGDWRPRLRRVNQAGSACFVGLLSTVARAFVDLACCATSSLSNVDIAAIIAVNTR
jgi:hypothetical protein